MGYPTLDKPMYVLKITECRLSKISIAGSIKLFNDVGHKVT